MNALNLAFTPAIEQAQLIQRREISPLELTELYLRRIEHLNPKVGSFFHVMADQAYAEAKAKTEQLATRDGTNFPPFFGVPTSIKDLNAVAGTPCSYGIPMARDRITDTDDGMVTRIRQAGFIILGKTATSQIGSLPYTEPPGFPPARNPWNLDYTPGGSSGGASSAVAAGLCAVAQGSDAGGSVRGPAACCGLVGLKPSRGRISNAPVGARVGGLATNGPLGRSVADVAAFLDIMAGYVTGDPYWLPDPNPPFRECATRPPGQLRIAVATYIRPVETVDSTCQAAVMETAKLLAELGHTIEPVTWPDLTKLIEPFTILWQCVMTEATAAGVPGFVLEKFNRWLLGRARRIGSGRYVWALTQAQVIAREIVAFCEPYDVMLLPVYTHPAPGIGEWAKLRPARTLEKVITWVTPCPPFNVSGQPSISIPGSVDQNGVPIGVQLVGRPADEATLISLAAQIEAARPWADRRPEIACF